MDDLISRQAAIDAVHEEFDECLVWDESGQVTADEVERILSDLPSADIDLSDYSDRLWRKAYEQGKADAQQWIPVTERLPEEKQDVLLAFRHNMVVGFWEDILNDGGQAWYANSGNGWFTGTESVDDDGFPIAWMPLPECYRGDGNGE